MCRPDRFWFSERHSSYNDRPRDNRWREEGNSKVDQSIVQCTWNHKAQVAGATCRCQANTVTGSKHYDCPSIQDRSSNQSMMADLQFLTKVAARQQRTR